MIHTLESISLSDFLRVYEGNTEYAGDGKESTEAKNKASEQMIMEYLEIVGGKTVLCEISKKSEQINNDIKFNLMNSCDNLIKLGDWESVSDILSLLGFKIFPSNHEKIRQRIRIIRSSAKMKMDMVKQAPEMKADKDYFIKERTMAMGHFKMHIDPDVYKAKEYAYLVKRMCDDISAMKPKRK